MAEIHAFASSAEILALFLLPSLVAQLRSKQTGHYGNAGRMSVYNSYGKCAIKSRSMIVDIGIDPKVAWERAAAELFESTSLRQKGCPRDAFLGLCGEGQVKGVHPGNYTRSKKNKEYALFACAKLRATPSLNVSPSSLWCALGVNKAHNGQMDVVIALWQEGLIDTR
jgi:hypothetical protein